MTQATELEFLRYFYKAAGDAFGPADADVYDCIKQNFVKVSHKTLPEGYGLYFAQAIED